MQKKLPTFGDYPPGGNCSKLNSLYSRNKEAFASQTGMLAAAMGDDYLSIALALYDAYEGVDSPNDPDDSAFLNKISLTLEKMQAQLKLLVAR